MRLHARWTHLLAALAKGRLCAVGQQRTQVRSACSKASVSAEGLYSGWLPNLLAGCETLLAGREKQEGELANESWLRARALTRSSAVLMPLLWVLRLDKRHPEEAPCTSRASKPLPGFSQQMRTGSRGSMRPAQVKRAAASVVVCWKALSRACRDHFCRPPSAGSLAVCVRASLPSQRPFSRLWP